MAKKNLFVKVFAFLALFGILASIVATGILFLFSGEDKTMTDEQYKQLVEEYLKTNSGEILETSTGTIEENQVLTGSVE